MKRGTLFSFRGNYLSPENISWLRWSWTSSPPFIKELASNESLHTKKDPHARRLLIVGWLLITLRRHSICHKQGATWLCTCTTWTWNMDMPPKDHFPETFDLSNWGHTCSALLMRLPPHHSLSWPPKDHGLASPFLSYKSQHWRKRMRSLLRGIHVESHKIP